MRDASTHDLDSAPAQPVSAHERVRQKIVLAICLATGFATLLDQSVLNIAVPALRAELGAGRADVQWILAAVTVPGDLATYRLGISVGILISAVLALVALVASLFDRPETAPRLDPAQGRGAPERTVG